MKSPILKYTPDQKRAIALLEKQPLSWKELLAAFPNKNATALAALLRTPREKGKIFINPEGKYEVYSHATGLKVIKGQPQPYTAPPKLEFIYEIGKFPREKN